jgi:hypothetical protein
VKTVGDLGEGHGVVDVVRCFFDRCPQDGNGCLGPIGSIGAGSRARRLQPTQGLRQVTERHTSGLQHQAHHEGGGLGLGRMHHRAAHVPAPDGDETFRLENAERLPQGRAAHLELFEKFVLLGKELAVSDLAVHNPAPQAGRDEIRDPRLAKLGSSTRSPLRRAVHPVFHRLEGTHIH